MSDSLPGKDALISVRSLKFSVLLLSCSVTHYSTDCWDWRSKNLAGFLDIKVDIVWTLAAVTSHQCLKLACVSLNEQNS